MRPIVEYTTLDDKTHKVACFDVPDMREGFLVLFLDNMRREYIKLDTVLFFQVYFEPNSI